MTLRSLFGRGAPSGAVPADGFAPSPLRAERLDRLTAQDLQQINTLLKWNCFTVDAHGRRFGDMARPGKRDEPQVIPDRRIGLFDAEFGLRGKTVLEVGCFEAIHTIALAMAGAQVTAIDARMENVVKSILRCHFYGVQADLRRCDVEIEAELRALPDVDLLHHMGVLYHLVDPVQHLRWLAPKVRLGLMLDTHVAASDRATDTLNSGGRSYRCQRVGEAGVAEVFAGMYDHACWLPVDDLLALLVELGFTHTRLHEERAERNGPRVLIFARR